MKLNSIKDLKPAAEIALIINVGTKWVSTLALLSALRYAEMPILLVDCESKDNSFEHFSELMNTHNFDLLAAPLKKHGYTLDDIFTQIPAEKVLLIDSDAEILKPEIIKIIKSAMQHPEVFGAGFTHGPTWLDARHGAAEKTGYYQERMWIPFSFLKTEFVCEALAAGHSFIDRTVHNNSINSRRISKIADLAIGKLPGKNLKSKIKDSFKRDYYGNRPDYVYYDTGADVFQFLKYKKGYYFAGLPAEAQDYVAHYHGVTRLILDPNDPNGTELSKILDTVLHRLKTEYGINAQ